MRDPARETLALTAEERARYSRHVLMPEIGDAGQRRLKAARVLVVGVGGLGSPAALYLAAAGVGTITLIDFDTVDETNLQRQILFADADVGRPKLGAAAARIGAQNPLVRIELVDAPLSAKNARQLIQDADVVLDGTDNFTARYLVNDACVMAGVPNVFGSVHRFEGQAAVFAAPGGPCYRCLHPEPPPEAAVPTCADAGVLGVVPGVIGMIQATEAIKLITGAGEPLVGRLLLYDALRMRVRIIALPRDAECPVCGDRPTIRDLVETGAVCAAAGEFAVTADELRTWRRMGRAHVLVDVREPGEHAIRRIEGAMLIPLDDLGSAATRLPRDRPVVVHCATGRRSALAAAMLRARGFDARDLVGGLDAWARHPLVGVADRY